MKKEIVIFISDNYADWEIAFIGAELNKLKEEYEVNYVALTKNTITSMGGLTVTPDYSISEYLAKASDHVHLLLLCGGTFWKENEYILPEVKRLTDWCHEKDVCIAAICDATTFLANNLYLNGIKHTGNSLEYIKTQCKGYTGQDEFIEKQCVYHDQFITANGTATLEFATEILKYLHVSFEFYTIDEWYIFNKKGMFATE